MDQSWQRPTCLQTDRTPLVFVRFHLAEGDVLHIAQDLPARPQVGSEGGTAHKS